MHFITISCMFSLECCFTPCSCPFFAVVFYILFFARTTTLAEKEYKAFFFTRGKNRTKILLIQLTDFPLCSPLSLVHCDSAGLASPTLCAPRRHEAPAPITTKYCNQLFRLWFGFTASLDCLITFSSCEVMSLVGDGADAWKWLNIGYCQPLRYNENNQSPLNSSMIKQALSAIICLLCVVAFIWNRASLY